MRRLSRNPLKSVRPANHRAHFTLKGNADQRTWLQQVILFHFLRSFGYQLIDGPSG